MEVSVYDSVNAAPVYGDPALQGSTLAPVIVVYSDDQSVRGAISAGLAHALKDELVECPPIMVIIQRAQDSWLAKWSGAEAVISHPIDPFTLGSKVAELLH